MKRIMKILGIIVIIMMVLFILLYIRLKIEANKPMVDANYWEKVQTGGDIEKRYMQMEQEYRTLDTSQYLNIWHLGDL